MGRAPERAQIRVGENGDCFAIQVQAVFQKMQILGGRHLRRTRHAPLGCEHQQYLIGSTNSRVCIIADQRDK